MDTLLQQIVLIILEFAPQSIVSLYNWGRKEEVIIDFCIK